MATNTVATKQTHTAANNASGNTSGPYTISFDYLLESDVEVRVDNTLKTQTTHYTFPSKTSIQFTSGNFPTAGAVIEIKRNTDITVPKVDFQDGSVLTESDLDNNSKHILFGMQETKEDTESLVSTFVSANAPTGISNGARWYDTVSGRTFVYYVDTDTAQWVEANPPFDATEFTSNITNTNVATNAAIDSTKLSFTQTGTGAVARTVDNRLKDGFSVKDFGAKGDGTTDDTTAFQAAIDAAEIFIEPATASDATRNQNNRCVIKIPSGIYKITSTLNINGPGVHLIGEGTAGTMILFSTGSTTTGDLFDVNHASQAGGSVIQNIGFRGISFFRTNTGNPTAGAAIKLGVVKHSYVQSCQFNGFYIDIHLQGTQEPCFIQECNFFQNNNFSTSSQITGSSHIKSEAIQLTDSSYEKPVNINVSNCEFRTENKVKQHGVSIQHCDGFYIQNSHFLNHRFSVSVLRQVNGVPAANIRLSNNFFDGSQGASATPTLRNVWIESTLTGTTGNDVTDVVIQNCKFNGVGDASTGVESWLYVKDPRTRLLNVQGCTFDKALNETSRAFFIDKGRGVCCISDNTILLEKLFVPTIIFGIGMTGSNSVDEFWESIILSSNRILYGRQSASDNNLTSDTGNGGDLADFNVRIANNINKVIITNNIFTNDSNSNGDGLLYSTATGTVIGAANSHGNIAI